MTSEECAALKAKIDKLTASYEDVISGEKPRVLVDQNGERIEYTQANAAKLLTYIRGLEGRYSDECSLDSSSTSGPMRFFF